MSYNFAPKPDATIAETIKDFFNYLDKRYKAKDEGCKAIESEWMLNKAKRFDELFKNIEGYDSEAHAIVINTNFYRKTNRDVVNYFFDCYVRLKVSPIKLMYYDGKTVEEWNKIFEYFDNLLYKLKRVKKYVNPHAFTGVYEEYKKSKNYASADSYDPEDYALFKREMKFCDIMRYYYSQFIDDECAKKINDLFPEAKAVSGTKTSKVARKILTKYFRGDFKNADKFESEYAKYSDAINPIAIPRKTIISWHIMDFLTSSFGVNWTSCMSPDKNNLHEYSGRTAGYRGCYSSGTLSYGLDDSTIILYTVNSDAKKPYWNLPKIDRQLFHISENGTSIIQGRYYPYDQGDAGNNASYEEYEPNRLLIQSIISKAYGFNNIWKNKRGTSDCSCYSDSYGTHYRDYLSYNNCNISYLPNTPIETIYIGHDPICPSCGKEHYEGEWCTCDSCRNMQVCAACGEVHHINEMLEIGGQYYCDNCSFYCSWHEDREIGNYYQHVLNYGDVCEEGFNELVHNELIHKDSYTDDWFYGRHRYSLTVNETGEILFFYDSYNRTNWIRNNSNISVTVNN